MSNSKIPFGLDSNGNIVDVHSVPRGLSCGCTCPGCGTPLVARKGTKTVHHFAHYRDQNNEFNCEHGLESGLHKAAKKIISEGSLLKLPELVIDGITLYKPRTWKYSQAKQEVRLGDSNHIVVDVMLSDGKRSLAIEIAVTHFIDKDKLDKIKELNLSTIEIDLGSHSKEVTDFNSLRNLLMKDSLTKQWIHTSKLDKLLDEVARKKEERRLYREKMEAIRREAEEKERERELIRQKQEKEERELARQKQEKDNERLRELFWQKAKERARIEEEIRKERINKEDMEGVAKGLIHVLRISKGLAMDCPIKKRSYGVSKDLLKYYADVKKDCPKCAYRKAIREKKVVCFSIDANKAKTQNDDNTKD